jgi:superoxide reductase
MPKITLPTDVTPEMKEAKRDYLDRHTPHVIAPAKATKGETFQVTVRMGHEYVHPDLPEHYIQSLQLYRGDKLIAATSYMPGSATAGKEPASGFSQSTFSIALDASAKLSAISYCTMHGLWMSEEVPVEIA